MPHLPPPSGRRLILQSHILQISGANLTIRLERDLKTGATREQPLILFGEGKLAKELGFTTAGLGSGGFHLEAKENVLALLGTDLQTPADTGGTLYATSTFLEEKLGVRYLWPGETGKMPRRPYDRHCGFQSRLRGGDGAAQYPQHGIQQPAAGRSEPFEVCASRL